MNNKEFRHVGLYKFSAVFIALGFAALVVYGPDRTNLQAGKNLEAQKQAEILAQEILQRKTSTGPKNARIPASSGDNESEGTIGLDPWGNPYKYNVLETDMGVARVVVRTQSSENSEIQGYVEPQSRPMDGQDVQPEY